MREFNFDKVLVALQNELYCFTYKLIVDGDEVENLLQETMSRTLDNKDKSDSGTNFKGWTYIIMRNVFIDNCWTEKIRGNLYVLSEPEYHFLLRGDSFILVDNRCDVKEIRETLKTLPKAHYVVFMSYRSQISGDSHKDRSVAEYDKKSYLLQQKKAKTAAFQFCLIN